MVNKLVVRIAVLAGLGTWCITWAETDSPAQSAGQVPPGAGGHDSSLERRFTATVKPFLERYCYSCHSSKKPKASLDLSRDGTVKAIAGNLQVWELVQRRLQAEEMPPQEAKTRPEAKERAAVITWLKELRDREAERNAGDPGIVLARRLSNAEFDYTIRDLTGVDIRPTREFPVDPANEAGFDNSGESLAMSPALLKKYLAAVRLIADHVVLKPDGFVFAPYPVVTDTDRDKYCVQRIIDFYQKNKVDYADYFQAAWKYRHRAALDRPVATLDDFAAEARLSGKYLQTIWTTVNAPQAEAGPLAAVQKLWRDLPGTKEGARTGCELIRDTVVRWRSQLKPTVKKLSVSGISAGSQPLVLWSNRQLAAQHRTYAGDAVADVKKLALQLKDNEKELVRFFAPGKAEKGKLRQDLERFCQVFPCAFVVADRGPYFSPKQADKGRPLTAGFHLMQGYFRDDQPLYDMILDEAGRRELDALWHELNFVTLAPLRQYKDFIFFERAEPPRFMFEAEFDFARSEDKDCTSAAKMKKLAQLYLAKARKNKAGEQAAEAIDNFFTSMSAKIRKIERAHRDAEPSHLQALLQFTERAYRRPLTKAEQDDLLGFYRKLRTKDELSHEDALRDALASVLLSPHFLYRVDLAKPGAAAQPLSSYALASRLSYFLWSSMPDGELLRHAASDDLRKPAVLRAQVRRMLRDPKARALAVEFAGNWLDIRRFEEHNAVDRERFPSFTSELRQAMFEEPIHYFLDIVQKDRPILDLLYGKDTFVNLPLARHYGMPEPGSKMEIRKSKSEDAWVHVVDAEPYGRGGLLPMAVFLTKNAPGLRTSPVKRGYWVVRRVLGEQIPPPPPAVPELPKEEAKLGELTLAQVLARHRADKSCAGCHNRFDAIGLVFEGFGPIGERRARDLGGRPVLITAIFPDGKERTGLDGLRDYLREKRQDDFVDNLSRKLFSYALGRSLMLSDQKALGEMRKQLIANDYRFGSLVEAIVNSPQFLKQRGRDARAEGNGTSKQDKKDDAGSIQIVVGQGDLITIQEDISEVKIANPALADFVLIPIDNRQIRVIGKQAGRTELSVRTRANIYTLKVEVAAAEDRVKPKQRNKFDEILEIPAGQQLLLTLPKGITKGLVALGDPSIADIKPVDPRRIIVIAKKVGLTDLQVIANKTDVFHYEIQVVAPDEKGKIKKQRKFEDIIELTLGRERVLTFKVDLITVKGDRRLEPLVALGDPSIADFKILDKRRVQLIPKKAGLTDLLIITGNGEVFHYEIRVKASPK